MKIQTVGEVALDLDVDSWCPPAGTHAVLLYGTAEEVKAAAQLYAADEDVMVVPDQVFATVLAGLQRQVQAAGAELIHELAAGPIDVDVVSLRRAATLARLVRLGLVELEGVAATLSTKGKVVAAILPREVPHG